MTEGLSVGVLWTPLAGWTGAVGRIPGASGAD